MPKQHILVVDDEKSVRDMLSLILGAAGYKVSTAEHGFDALVQLKTSNLPDLIISDLNMPQMSGFEFLSVVRRRFPQIAVIASSGAYHSGDAVPGGIIADAFHAKGAGPIELLQMVAALLAMSEDRITERHTGSAPVDSEERPRLKRNSLHCGHLSRLPALVSTQRAARGFAGRAGDRVHVLPYQGPLHHRFLAGRRIA